MQHAICSSNRTEDSGAAEYRARIQHGVQASANGELVKYMRGDSTRKGSMKEPIHTYVHTYYEDIEQLHRDNIYRLGI